MRAAIIPLHNDEISLIFCEGLQQPPHIIKKSKYLMAPFKQVNKLPVPSQILINCDYYDITDITRHANSPDFSGKLLIIKV